MEMFLLCFRVIAERSRSGWGGRIRTFNLPVQSRLRYRCATPQQAGPPILATTTQTSAMPVFHTLSPGKVRSPAANLSPTDDPIASDRTSGCKRWTVTSPPPPPAGRLAVPTPACANPQASLGPEPSSSSAQSAGARSFEWRAEAASPSTARSLTGAIASRGRG